MSEQGFSEISRSTREFFHPPVEVSEWARQLLLPSESGNVSGAFAAMVRGPEQVYYILIKPGTDVNDKEKFPDEIADTQIVYEESELLKDGWFRDKKIENWKLVD